MSERFTLCAYGDCHEEMPSGKGFKLTVTYSFNGSRMDQQSFCCYEHGWRWLKERDDRLNHNAKPKEVAR
jgi:hypothetical protein